MILFPKLYLNNIKEISMQILQEKKLKALILDVDNTLIDYNKNLLEGTKQWATNLKENGIKLCIVSNSNNKTKVAKVAKVLEIPYIYFAKKPFKSGFKKAQNILQVKKEEIGVVGDQILTDVIGANRCKMFPILVKPINERDFFITKIKRPLEKIIIKKYEKNIKNKF